MRVAAILVALMSLLLVLSVSACGGTGAADGLSDVQRRPSTAWRTNTTAIELIKRYEGLRLEAYSLNGRWYIGYGHQRTAKKGMRITAARAEELLRTDVRACEQAVARAVLRPVTENQFGAMTSLCYNIGTGAFRGSTVVRALNAGDEIGAADAFLLWVKAGGQVVEHLENRREDERALFLTP